MFVPCDGLLGCTVEMRNKAEGGNFEQCGPRRHVRWTNLNGGEHVEDCWWREEVMLQLHQHRSQSQTFAQNVPDPQTLRGRASEACGLGRACEAALGLRSLTPRASHLLSRYRLRRRIR